MTNVIKKIRYEMKITRVFFFSSIFFPFSQSLNSREELTPLLFSLKPFPFTHFSIMSSDVAHASTYLPFQIKMTVKNRTSMLSYVLRYNGKKSVFIMYKICLL